MTGLLFPKCSADDVRNGSLTRNYSSGLDAQFGAYLAGPTNQSDNCKKPPTVYICENGQTQMYKMIVYNALSGTLCLFVNGKGHYQHYLVIIFSTKMNLAFFDWFFS